jgi:FkbH-like protein
MISPNTPDLSYRRLAGKGRHLLCEEGWPKRRVAILSDAASQQFVPVLRALFHENGISVETYEGIFDAFEMEVLDPGSGLYAFRPDVVILASCAQALRSRYFHNSESDFARCCLERVQGLWGVLRAQSNAQILQFNYAMPYERFFGNFDLLVPHSLYASISRLNALLAAAAPEHDGVTLIDVEMISSNVGRAAWYDDRLWNMTKAFCRLEHLPLVCQSIVEVVLTLMGRVTKCLILDLDNTLWGGIVGDLGHLGVEIGAHGDGEAFYHFQNYLLALKKRGIILAVCSKNEIENALRPFSDNPEMVLRRNDIAVFVANWENKADNIRTIRERLNIGFDSMVFLDDNPFERNLVRQLVPDVIVPELTEDPADYVRFLSSLNLFETTSYSPADARRAEQYKEEAERLELKALISDVTEYLKSLEMKIHVARFDPENLSRIAQLTQRSNQFNMTTQRLTEGECREMMLDDEAWIPLYASLSDRFGDHGLISVVTLRHARDAISIANWLMSCRVLSRGVEEYLMARVVKVALERRVARIEAEYIPTAKNAMVKGFYSRFGFDLVGENAGHTRWALNPELFRPAPTYITES